MSKTLYVGFYDYPYCYKAYECINNAFVEIDISGKNMENDIGAIYDYDCEDNKIQWYDQLSYEVRQYDNIIVCNDGCYSFIDLTKLKKEEFKINEVIKATSLHTDNKDLAKDFGYNFILAETPEPQEPKTLQDYTDEELLKELLRRKEQ